MSHQNQNLIGIEIFGGLGNQMFQYAAALALSRRLGAELSCDAYLPAGDPLRPLGLRELGASWREQRTPRARGWLRAVGRSIGLREPNPFNGATYFEEREGFFNPEFMQLVAPVFLHGYFQSWRYFEGHEEAVRAAFDIERLRTERSAQVEARIRAARHPVAVHVRRGDFSDTPRNAALRGPLGPDYYRQARASIEARVDTPTYFLFSDEPATAMAALSDWPDLMPVAELSAHEDLRLMALCEHFIIANSTFSWWAAWLGRAPGKVVVAPSVWFGPAYRETFVLADRVPPDWLVL